jgi:hypothetical protein
MVYSLRFFLFKMQVYFIIVTYLVPFYTQGVLKLKKIKSGAKRLREVLLWHAAGIT